MTELDTRRRRALYRATHRGTKELDLMVGRFATAHVAAMDEASLADFERLLSEADPEIDFWLRGGGEGEAGEFSSLIATMRAFLGLTGR